MSRRQRHRFIAWGTASVGVLVLATLITAVAVNRRAGAQTQPTPSPVPRNVPFPQGTAVATPPRQPMFQPPQPVAASLRNRILHVEGTNYRYSPGSPDP